MYESENYYISILSGMYKRLPSVGGLVRGGGMNAMTSESCRIPTYVSVPPAAFHAAMVVRRWRRSSEVRRSPDGFLYLRYAVIPACMIRPRELDLERLRDPLLDARDSVVLDRDLERERPDIR